MQMQPVDGESRALGFQFEERDIKGQVDAARRVDADAAVVVQNVQLCEQHYRTKGLFSRWDEDDKLYNFMVPTQFWEGTQTPRSSIGIPIVLEHVNALSPQCMDILFEEDPPFYPLPYPGTTEDESRAITKAIEWACNKAEIEREMTAGGECGLLHGIGCQKIYVEYKDGYFCPISEYIERRFVFVSPKLRWPDVRKADWVAHQTWKTIEELDKMRELEGYKIPPMDEMLLWAIPDKEEPTKSNNETWIGYGSTPYAAELGPRPQYKPHSIAPQHHKVELLEYSTPTEIITVANRKRVIRKTSNLVYGKPWGHVRWTNCYFIRKDGMFDAMGLGQLLGNEQQLQQGVTNLQVDNLALTINKMIVREPGSGGAFSQPIKVSPGRIIDVAPEKIKVLEVGGIDASSFQFINDSDQRAVRRSGANEVAVQGSFPESSGGIGRTAQGMALLAQGATARLRRYVKTLEEQVFIPYLEWLVECYFPYFMDRGLLKEILGPDFSKLNLKKMLVNMSKTQFKFLASTKMKRRAAMLSAVPTLIQHYQNEFVLDSVKSQFKKVDHSKLNSMIWDAAGWPNEYEIITDMTKEEKEQLMSENELVKQLTIMRATEAIKGKEKLKQIEAEGSVRIMNTIVKDAVADGSMRDQQKYQAGMDAGAMKANSELDRYSDMPMMESLNAGINTGTSSPNTGR